MFIAVGADNLVSYVLAVRRRSSSATANVVGGYVVTDRMLQMFRKKPVGRQAGPKGAPAPANG